MLDIKVPLLDVGPKTFRVNGVEAQREGLNGSAGRTNVGVATDVRLAWEKDKGRSRFKRLDIRLVAVAMFVEDSIPAANSCFTVAPGVPSKTDARGRIE